MAKAREEKDESNRRALLDTLKETQQQTAKLKISDSVIPQSIVESNDLLANILQLAKRYQSQIYNQQELITTLRLQLLERDEEILILKEQLANNKPGDLDTLMRIMERARNLGIIENAYH